MSYNIYILPSDHSSVGYIVLTEEIDKRVYKQLNSVDSKNVSSAKDWEVFLDVDSETKTHAIKQERIIQRMKRSQFMLSLNRECLRGCEK
jgi:predicted GIY-YIG superfamily endonuclease